jgi:hypothetical protein
VNKTNKKTGIDKQKTYFELLVDVTDSPLSVAKNWRRGNDFGPGKRHLLGKAPFGLPPLDHRTISKNEVIGELDAKSYAQNARYGKLIVTVLKELNIPHYCFWSGNKSIHIHVFLKLEVNSPSVKRLVKECLEEGINIYAAIRIAFMEEILEQAGLSKHLIGNGKIVDLAKLKWDDIGGKSTLIRCAGGANIKIQDDNKLVKGFKTYLENIPDKKPKMADFEEVNYPEKLEKYVLPQDQLADICEKELKKAKSKSLVKKIKYEGKFSEFPCIQKIREGLKPGIRNVGAKVLAIASRLDGLTVDESKELVMEFADSCSQIKPFTPDEAFRWVEWIYKETEPFWNCCHAKNIGACERLDCPYFQQQHEEDLEFFNQDQPLAEIKKALDISIVGENTLKMQLFLLFLTKNFNPEWCIIIDGPAASGKTHVMKKVAELFGEENDEFFVYSRLTTSSLNHMEDLAKEWAGKIVIIEELQGAKNVVEQLRVAISEGKLILAETTEVMEKGQKKFVTKPKTVYFKDVLFVTCNAEEFDEGEQLKSRAWILNTDQTNIQTNMIVDHYLNEFGKEISREIPNLERIRHSLRLLETPHEVVFPFASLLKGIVPTNTVRGRRDVKKFISLIKAVAYLHQHKRNWFTEDGKKYLVADWRDARMALGFAGESLNASTQGVGARDLHYYDKIAPHMSTQFHTGIGSCSISEVCDWCKITPDSARKLMSSLCGGGFFENTTTPPNPAKYIMCDVKPFHYKDLDGHMKEMQENQEKPLQEWIKNLRISENKEKKLL